MPFAAFDSYGLSAYVSGDTAQRNGAPIAARDDGMPITIIKTGAAAGTAETAAVSYTHLLGDMCRDILQLGVKACHSGVLGGHDLFHQFIKCHE